ncbi:MAG TPA: hypothetical protein VN661_10785 [Candidatus Acidoferrales bacterium]|nr:hypothetical protein [Candidatus Acidoferrales bacterium]
MPDLRGRPYDEGTTRCFAQTRGRGKAVRVVTLCSQCDKPEQQCTCEKYCCFCQSQQHIRLCVDGLYYCPECREACDVRTAETDRP